MLKNSLMDLVKAELKEFRWHLENDHECISNSEMEEADIFDTVNKMVRCFGPDEAVKIAVDMLRKMNQNNLAEQLENKHKQAQAEGNMKTSVPVGADSKQSLDPFQNNRSPEWGGLGPIANRLWGAGHMMPLI
ncbi:hypothetical protein M9458_052315 [Cirrhinus mrigala]